MFAEFLQNDWITIGAEVNSRALIESTHNKTFSVIRGLIQDSNFKDNWGCRDGQVASYLSMHPQEVHHADDSSDSSMQHLEGADIVMMRLASACKQCPISQQMIPSLFQNGRFKDIHPEGVYVVGKVVQLPSPNRNNHPKSDMFQNGFVQKKWGAAWVQVQWLKMGYMHEISNYNYVKTFTEVKKESFKQEVLKFAVHKLPKVVKVTNWQPIRDRLT